MTTIEAGRQSGAPTIELAGLAPGFADPVRDAQATFRAVLDALAHPGRIIELPVALAAPAPKPLRDAAAAVALTLCDMDTPVWLDAGLVGCADYLRFHCGAPLVPDPGTAHFAFIGDGLLLPSLDAFALGSDEYPDRSTTLIIEVADLQAGKGRYARRARDCRHDPACGLRAGRGLLGGAADACRVSAARCRYHLSRGRASRGVAAHDVRRDVAGS